MSATDPARHRTYRHGDQQLSTGCRGSRFGWLWTGLIIAGLSGCGHGTSPSTGPGESSPFDAAASTTLASPPIVATQAQVAPTIATPTATSVPALVAAEPSTEPATATLGLTTPEAASQNLWDAWRDNDRERALLYASKTAVDSLFATRWQPDAQNEGCGTVSTIRRCVFLFTEKSKLVARLVIITGSDMDGYRATRVDSVGDLPQTNRLDSALVEDTIVVGSSDATLDTGVTSTDPLLVAPTVATLPGTPAAGATVKKRATIRKKTTTVAKKAKATTTPTSPSPAAAPSPAPTPAPAQGPVQVRTRPVDTVAPG